MGCRLQSCVISKSDSTMRQFFEIFGGEIIPTKKSVLDSYLVAICNICENRLVHGRCPLGYCEKYHVQRRSYGL